MAIDSYFSPTELRALSLIRQCNSSTILSHLAMPKATVIDFTAKKTIGFGSTVLISSVHCHIHCHFHFDVIECFTFSCALLVPIFWTMVFSRSGALLERNTSTFHIADVLHALMRTTLNGSPPCFSLRRVRRFKQQPNRGRLFLDSRLFIMTFYNFSCRTPSFSS